MKKILILITILIMAIASCSSPTAIKNNGGGSDINDNTSTNPPVVVPPDNGNNNGSGGNDSGNNGGDNNTGGGSNGGDTGTGGGNGNGSTGGDNGNNGGNTGGDNNNGSTNPPPVVVEYKGIARVIKYRDAIGKWFEVRVYSDAINDSSDPSKLYRYQKVRINADGSINFERTQGSENSKFFIARRQYNHINPDKNFGMHDRIGVNYWNDLTQHADMSVTEFQVMLQNAVTGYTMWCKFKFNSDRELEITHSSIESYDVAAWDAANTGNKNDGQYRHIRIE